MNSTFAACAVAPALAKPSAKSFEDTAKAASTLANLLTISEEFMAASLKPLIAAVKAFTASTESMPDNLVNIIASAILCKVSSALKPCLANSVAAAAISLNEDAVFLATSNNAPPKLCKADSDMFIITLISFNAF